MSKRVQITQVIRDQISKNTDGSVNADTVAVYECIAANTLPLSKRGTLFDKGRLTESLLNAMAEWVGAADQGKSVPLHALHAQGYELPIGRVFHGEALENSNGNHELRLLFYVPLTETDIVSKLDSNVIDEVSVGVRPKHICCSECGWDYLSEEATFSNLWSQTCANEHEIGVDGIHTISSGLDNFMELSLVSKGAANNAKILSRTKQLLGKEEYNRLAASGSMPEITTLFLTAAKDTHMDLTALVADLTTAKANVTVQASEITKLTADNTNLVGKVSTLEAENADLKTKVSTDLDSLKASAETAQKQADEAIAFVRLEADRLCVAAGTEKLAETADFAALTASIKTNRSKMAEMFSGAGAGNSEASASNQGTKEVKTSSAFKLPR